MTSLFAASVKVYSTEVTPTGNSEPGWCDCVLVVFPDRSVAVGSVHDIDLLEVPSSVVVSMLCGHPSISGGVVSTTEKYVTRNKWSIKW